MKEESTKAAEESFLVPESGFEALQVWDKEAIVSSPLVLKVWLLVMALTVLSSLLFVKRYNSARAVFALTGLGLVFTKLLAPQLGLIVFSGLVALTHVLLWPISLFFLYRDSLQPKLGAYGYWIRWTAAIFVISLFFDVRDAIIYLAFIMDIG